MAEVWLTTAEVWCDYGREVWLTTAEIWVIACEIAVWALALYRSDSLAITALKYQTLL